METTRTNTNEKATKLLDLQVEISELEKEIQNLYNNIVEKFKAPNTQNTDYELFWICNVDEYNIREVQTVRADGKFVFEKMRYEESAEKVYKKRFARAEGEVYDGRAKNADILQWVNLEHKKNRLNDLYSDLKIAVSKENATIEKQQCAKPISFSDSFQKAYRIATVRVEREKENTDIESSTEICEIIERAINYAIYRVKNFEHETSIIRKELYGKLAYNYIHNGDPLPY